MVDGQPQFTKQMLDTTGTTWFQKLRANTTTVVVSDWRIELAGFSKDEKEAITVKWANVGDEWNLPTGITYTAEEDEILSTVFSEIKLYAQSKIGAFITGEEPLSNWQEFQSQMKKMGLDKCVQTIQTAYDRYMAK